MSQLRSRTAVSPPFLPTVDALVAVERPDMPVLCLRPAAITEATRRFCASFPGDVLYAVKCNPEPAVLRAVWDGGVHHFDCASANEVLSVRALFPDAAIHFMHPVKARSAIRVAFAAGVRDFVLDHTDELIKLVAETGAPDELGLIVRIAPPPSGAVYDLSGKFGATVEDAAELLRAARPLAARLGVSFHVGSQCLDPLAWRRAISAAGEAIRLSGVAVDIIDVGGGFPVAYVGMTPPPLGAFLAEIEAAVDALALPVAPRLLLRISALASGHARTALRRVRAGCPRCRVRA